MKLCCARSFTLLVIVIGTSLSVKASPILIDDWSTEQDVGLIGIPNFIPSSSQVGPSSNILGGFRDIQALGNADSFLETRLQVTGGQLSFSNTVGTTGIGEVTWDGDDDPTSVDTVGLGSLDITQNNGWTLDSIAIEIFSSDLPGLELMFTIWDMNTDASTLSRAFDASITSAFTETFMFTDFVGTADLTNVGAIQMQIVGPAEIDASFGNLEIVKQAAIPVPEPTTLALLVTGLIGACLTRKQIRTNTSKLT